MTRSTSEGQPHKRQILETWFLWFSSPWWFWGRWNWCEAGRSYRVAIWLIKLVATHWNWPTIIIYTSYHNRFFQRLSPCLSEWNFLEGIRLSGVIHVPRRRKLWWEGWTDWSFSRCGYGLSSPFPSRMWLLLLGNPCRPSQWLFSLWFYRCGLVRSRGRVAYMKRVCYLWSMRYWR